MASDEATPTPRARELLAAEMPNNARRAHILSSTPSYAGCVSPKAALRAIDAALSTITNLEARVAELVGAIEVAPEPYEYMSKADFKELPTKMRAFVDAHRNWLHRQRDILGIGLGITASPAPARVWNDKKKIFEHAPVSARDEALEEERLAEKLLVDFYVSDSYDPIARRPADTVKAAIAFTIRNLKGHSHAD